MPLGNCLSRNLDAGSRLLAALGSLAALGFAGVVAAGTIDLSPCDLTSSEGRQEVDAQCGTLDVPLDPADPDGATIELFVAVVEALAEQPSPDPLVVIAGGPGDAATRFFAAAEPAFARILRDRDVVLVDQRGSGRSAPLHCDSSQDAPFLADTDVQAVIDAGLECLGNLEHDPRFFTTSAAVGDLDHVRAALGYEQVNPVGTWIPATNIRR